MLSELKEWLGFGDYNCIVIYQAPKRQIKKETIQDPPGYPHIYKGKLIHLLKARDGTGEYSYEPLEPLTVPIRLDISPLKLGRSRRCYAAIRWRRRRLQLYERVAVWGLVAAIAIGGVLLFLMSAGG